MLTILRSIFFLGFAGFVCVFLFPIASTAYCDGLCGSSITCTDDPNCYCTINYECVPVPPPPPTSCNASCRSSADCSSSSSCNVCVGTLSGFRCLSLTPAPPAPTGTCGKFCFTHDDCTNHSKSTACPLCHRNKCQGYPTCDGLCGSSITCTETPGCGCNMNYECVYAPEHPLYQRKTQKKKHQP